MDFYQCCYDCMTYVLCLPLEKENYRYTKLNKYHADMDDEIVFSAQETVLKIEKVHDPFSVDDFYIINKGDIV